jgi:hypothetical protein
VAKTVQQRVQLHDRKLMRELVLPRSGSDRCDSIRVVPSRERMLTIMDNSFIPVGTDYGIR